MTLNISETKDSSTGDAFLQGITLAEAYPGCLLNGPTKTASEPLACIPVAEEISGSISGCAKIFSRNRAYVKAVVLIRFRLARRNGGSRFTP